MREPAPLTFQAQKWRASYNHAFSLPQVTIQSRKGEGRGLFQEVTRGSRFLPACGPLGASESSSRIVCGWGTPGRSLWAGPGPSVPTGRGHANHREAGTSPSSSCAHSCLSPPMSSAYISCRTLSPSSCHELMYLAYHLSPPWSSLRVGALLAASEASEARTAPGTL